MNSKKTAIAVLSIIVPLGGYATQKQDKKRMNVIYILADDLGYGDLGFLGQEKISTPNIDKLRAEGMFFSQHYSGSTVSAPSRSALLTGQHTGHTPIRGNRELTGQEGQLPLPAGTYTMGRMFQDAGYTTGVFGKWGLGYPGSEGEPNSQGFDEFFGYNCQREAHRYYPDHLWHNRERVELEKNAAYRLEQFAPDIIHDRALEFIENNKTNNFFLYLAIIQPHAELLAPEDELLYKYRGVFDEKPYTSKAGAAYGPGMRAELYCPQNEPYASFAAMVGRVDKYVGEVVECLRLNGLDKNTIIFFSSDNGPHREGGANPHYFKSYGPFRGGKRDLYEGGIHVPLVAWSPGMIEAGSTSDHICAMWDMMPTLAQVSGAGIPKHHHTDGISILPALTGKRRQKEHEYLYWEYHDTSGKIAVRMGDWKCIAFNVRNRRETKFALYDLSTDIHEDNDVAADHSEVVNRIRKLMQSAHSDSPQFELDNSSIYTK